MANSGNNMGTALRRLEAVTSRLEDLAASFPGIAAQPGVLPASTTASAPSSQPAPTRPAAVEIDELPHVAEFQQIVDEKIQPALKLLGSISEGVEAMQEQTKLAERIWVASAGIVKTAGSCKKPDDKALQALIASLNEDIIKLGDLKSKNKKDRDYWDHMAVLAESSAAVGWIVNTKPLPYVTGVEESTQFYGNRIIKTFKEKPEGGKHVEWVRAYMGIFPALKSYIKEFHMTGLTWNPKGLALAEYQSKSASSAPPAAPAGGPPPPPPPPPPPGPPPPPPAGSAPAAPAGGHAALFADLSKGADVTKGLRKVDKSEMTHKNPALRASSVVPASTSPAAAPKRPTKPTKPQALAGKKPSKFALEGNKWVIEYQEDVSRLDVENVEMNQTVNLYGCKKATIVIKGKVNAVTIANCNKTSVLVESVVSTVSVTNSPSFTLQITGNAPTIQLDSTDSGQIFLSKDCLGVEITTAKCSSINVNLPVEGEEDGVFEEKAMPEMLMTKVVGGKLETTVVEHVG